MSFNIIYLHGFASSPKSYKANYFKNKFKSNKHIDVTIPDLNVPNFTFLSVNKQLELIKSLIKKDKKNIIIAASYGAYLAILLVENHQVKIDLMILMAPAINMASQTLRSMDASKIKNWEIKNFIDLDHYSYNKKIPLHYNFIRELRSYEKENYHFNTNTIVFHGENDTTVAYTISQKFLVPKRNCIVHFLNSDHRLLNQLDFIWNKIELELLKL